MTTASKRRTLSAKLTPGKDDPLIQWLDSVRRGDRNKAIKQALSTALQLPMPVMSSAANQDEVTALREEVAQLRAALQQSRQHPAAQELEQLREQLNSWSTWFEKEFQSYLRDQLQQLEVVSVAPIITIEAASQADSAILEDRAANMKKRGW